MSGHQLINPDGMAPAAVPVDVPLATVTVIDAVAVRPPVSVARTVSVWEPLATLVELQLVDQFVVPVMVANAPESTRISTLATPAVSAAVP